MFSKFFGNRLMRDADPFLIRQYMCPEISQEELDKFKALEGGGKAKDDEIAKLKAEIEKGKDGTPPPNDKDDLAGKAAAQREEADKQAAKEKQLEGSINFLVGSKDWAKTNAALLPKNIESILQAAEKENYASKVDKANAIKVAIVSEFFEQQSNLDLLTASQKTALADFLKLTKDKKQDQAQNVYDSIFEPTFETLKKVKRAEQVSKGHADQSSGEQAYLDRMKKGARKHHLKEKE